MTLDAWRVVRVLSHIGTHKGRVTIAILSDLVRGVGGGAFSAGGKKGKKSQQEVDSMIQLANEVQYAILTKKLQPGIFLCLCV